MKIYEITYEDDSCADGFARHYFTSKRAMRKGIAEVKQAHAEQTREAQARQDTGDPYPAFPCFRIDAIRTEELDITGTCQEMVLWALRYNS